MVGDPIQLQPEDMGASPDGDRATHERNPQAVSAVPVSVPSAANEHVTYWPGVAVVQPLLEAEPSFVRKVGAFAVFGYLRGSCFAVGIDFMAGGAALHLGPIMFGAVKIKTFEEYAQAIEARQRQDAKSGLARKGESAVPTGDAPLTSPQGDKPNG